MQWYLQVYNISRNMKKNIISNSLSSWNLRPKPNLVIAFWASLSMISFEDRILIFYSWVPNTTIEGAMKSIQFRQQCATTSRNLNKKSMILVQSTKALFLYIWPCLLPKENMLKIMLVIRLKSIFFSILWDRSIEYLKLLCTFPIL